MTDEPAFFWKRLGLTVAVIFIFLLVTCLIMASLYGGTNSTGALIGGLLSLGAVVLILELIAILIAFLILAWVAILIHEGGHIIGALLSGLRIDRVVIASKAVFQRKRAFTKPVTLKNYVSANSRNPTKASLLVFICFGPMANLVVASVSFWFLRLSVGNPSVAPLYFWSSFGFVNLALALLSLSKNPDGTSDGSKIFRILKNPEQEISYLQALAILADIANLAPRDYPLEDVKFLESYLKESPHATYYALHRAIAYRDQAEVLRCLKLGYERTKSSAKFKKEAGIFCGLMSGIAAIQLNDRDLSDEAYKVLNANDIDPDNLLFPELCREYAFGDRGKVADLKNKTIEVIRAKSSTGTDSEYLVDWVNHLVPDEI